MTTPKPRPAAVPVVVNVSGPVTVPCVRTWPGRSRRSSRARRSTRPKASRHHLVDGERAARYRDEGDAGAATVYVTVASRTLPATSTDDTVKFFVPTVAVSIGWPDRLRPDAPADAATGAASVHV